MPPLSRLPTQPIPRTVEILPIRQQALLDPAELWRFRHLFCAIVWRTIRVRYKQTVIGLAWVLLQPFLLMLVFTIIFGQLTNMPTHGQPYPIFVLSGLLVWLFVAQAFNQASISIVGNTHLITKIYFPRIILILAAITAAMFDFVCSLVLLIALMICYGISPTVGALLFVPMMLLAALTVFGLSLWISALHVTYRDVGHLLPFLTQLWMFLSPVVYPSDLLPAKYNLLFALNPIVVVIDVTRWAFAAGPAPASWMVAVSCAVATFVCITGFWFFRRLEANFPDIV